MCIFSGKVADVSSTNIFCREIEPGHHVTVYEMRAEVLSDLAMILPVPVKRNSGEDTLTFLNLEGYPDFFKDMKKLFPEPVSRGLRLGGPASASKGLLKVHDVGRYIASFVPRLYDLDRLDKQFKLDRTIWEMLPNYLSFGFAVFQLKPGQGHKPYHPMAYKYPAKDEKQIFFPTTHVHDGWVRKRAEYDHALYFQSGGQFGGVGWDKASFKPSDKMKIELALGIVDPLIPIERLKVEGEHDNHDHLLVHEDNDVTSLLYNEVRGKE